MTFLALIAIIFFGFAVYNLTCAFVDIPTKKTSQMMMLSRKQQGTKNEKLLDVYVTKIAGWIAPYLRLDRLKRNKIVQDFICGNSDVWKGKHIFIIATMGLFSGDGAGVSARLFKRYGAHIWGGLHLKMPDCICDVKALKRTPDQNKQIVIQAEECIKSAVYNLKNGTPTKNGLGFWCHIAGLLGQRLWFYRKTQAYSDKIQINSDTCIKCGKCALVCPMNNLSLSKGKIVANGRCTLCYRCVNQCSKKAITILGKKVISQSSIYDFGD